MADIKNLLDEIEENDDIILDGENGNDSSKLELQDLNIEEAIQVPLELRNAESQLAQDSIADLPGTSDRIEDVDDIDEPFHDALAQQDAEESLIGERVYNLDEDYLDLRKLWMQELSSPELLSHNIECFNEHLEILGDQEDTIDKLEDKAANPKSSGNSDPLLASLAASIHKVEADRIRFILADLTRTRLAKIEQHALHNRNLLDRMSEDEVLYLKNYGELFESHMRRSVLNHLPNGGNWDKLDEPQMIDKPNLDSYVFCRILETVELDNHKGLEGVIPEDEDEDPGESIQEHQSGSYLFVRYAVVRDLVFEGRAELIL